MYGDEALPYPLNVSIFSEVHNFIEESKRFWCDLGSWPKEMQPLYITTKLCNFS